MPSNSAAGLDAKDTSSPSGSYDLQITPSVRLDIPARLIYFVIGLILTSSSAQGSPGAQKPAAGIHLSALHLHCPSSMSIKCDTQCSVHQTAFDYPFIWLLFPVSVLFGSRGSCSRVDLRWTYASRHKKKAFPETELDQEQHETPKIPSDFTLF
jgi:hypothetical protein